MKNETCYCNKITILHSFSILDLFIYIYIYIYANEHINRSNGISRYYVLLIPCNLLTYKTTFTYKKGKMNNCYYYASD